MRICAPDKTRQRKSKIYQLTLSDASPRTSQCDASCQPRGHDGFGEAAVDGTKRLDYLADVADVEDLGESSKLIFPGGEDF